MTPGPSVLPWCGLSQILETKLHESIQTLYFKGKVYELLSLFFNKSEDADVEQCPF